MLARLSALVIWGLVAATAVFWGLRLLVRAPVAPAYTVAVGDASAVRGDLARLLGTAPVAPVAAVAVPEAASRFKLLGIAAPNSAASPTGVALIAVDGKMPKAYAVGSRVDGDLVLQSVSLRTVSIATGQGAAPITLQLPPLVAAATSNVPPGATGGMTASPPTVVPQYAPPFAPQPIAMPPTGAPPMPAPVVMPNPQGLPVNPSRTESGAPIQ
jgi:general secretion pathway protein C